MYMVKAMTLNFNSSAPGKNGCHLQIMVHFYWIDNKSSNTEMYWAVLLRSLLIMLMINELRIR